jgi:hypothetical protein
MAEKRGPNNSLAFDDDERGPTTPNLRIQLEALDKLDPDEQANVRAFIEGVILRHQVRQVNVTGFGSGPAGRVL